MGGAESVSLFWLELFPASRKLSPSGDFGTRKRRLAYYSYNSRDGGYSENTDLLRNRANQHDERDDAGCSTHCQIFLRLTPAQTSFARPNAKLQTPNSKL
jgi:hypothetical protein